MTDSTRLRRATARWREQIGHAALSATMLLCAAAGADAGQATANPGSSSSSGHGAHAAHAAMIARTPSGTSALTLPESIPDFSLDTSRPGTQSVASGPWSSPATWQAGQVPTANHVVRVLAGHRVTIDDTAAVAYTIAVDGTLAFAPNVATRLKVTNLEVMSGEMGSGAPGLLEVGTSASPIAAGVSAEIVIANTALGGGVADPLQFGTGMIVLGRLSMHGSPKTPTFVRLATEPRAGQTTLTLSQAVTGWAAGDRLVLPDTRHIRESDVTGSGWVNAVNQWEERTLQSVSADGKTLTLTTALQYDHLGARDLNGVLDFLPHVGNLTRNVVVRSESATGTRGHMLAIHKANVDIRHTLFRDMGRTTYRPLNTTTNHIGRYPIHMHHLSGPVTTPANGYQFTLIGNAVDGGSVETRFKWGIAVHGSHYGLIQDNVVYNYNGSAIATEDGSESFNVFDHNFALRGMGEPNNSVSEARNAMGTEGVGFWFRGPNNYVRNNVAANYQNSTAEAAYGFVYQFISLGDIATPKFKGADTMDAAQSVTRNGNNLPILQFENNEAYGAMQGGFTLWWVSSLDPQPAAGAQDSIIKDLKLWNTYNKTVYMYPSQKVIFDGLKIRGNFVPGVSRCCGNGVFFADYSSKGIVIRNSDIQGMEEGITAPEAGFGPEPNLIIENSYLRNVSNLEVPTNGSVNGCWMNNKLVVATNTQFAARPGSSLDAISMVRDVANAPECLGKLNEMRVYAYNGNPADNFQVYHTSSSVLPRPPSSCTPVTRPGISGLTCPIAALGAAIPTVTFTVSPGSVQAGQAALLNWNTANATTIAINQGVGTVAAAGSQNVSPSATTTYTLTATNAAGSATATATLTVTAPAPLPPTVTMTASPASIVRGASSTLNWTASNATSVTINQGIGTVAASGTRTVSPTATTTYTVTATNAAGSTTATATVTVTIPSSPSPSPSPTVTMSASPASIAPGASVILSWTTSNATSASINQGIGTVATSGTRTVSPTATTTYTLTATNASGSATATATVTVTTPSAQPPSVTITASPASIAPGGSATLSWSASNASAVSINQGIGAVTASGTRTVSPTATTSYTVTATNSGGSTTATAIVTLTSAAPLLPSVTISASPASIAAGASTTLSWAVTNATGVTIDQGIGTVAASGTRTVSPTATTTFTLTATNAAGSTTGAVGVIVGAPPQLAVSRTALYFGARGSFLTPPQTGAVRITNARGAAVTWTVASSASWLTVSGGGTGGGPFTAAVVPGAYPVGTQQAQITLASPGLESVVVPVSFTTHATTNAPVGSLDTPADNAVNVTGAFPVTGWALHEIAVSKVDVYRDAVAGEAPAGTLIFIGTAGFVEGARPDLEAASPTPFNHSAGWGLMVLSNVLPNGGNGVYTLRAIATGIDGTTAELGRKTITCANATAVLPFGTIDTPAQGETVSGTIMNWGWALTPLPSSIEADGSGLEIFIDGVSLGRPAYGQNRADISSLFPGLANSNGAVGYRVIDTTTLANGVHTIGWLVYDRHGRGEGIGSRFFNVQNTGVTAGQREDVSGAALLAAPAAGTPPGVRARIGFHADAPFADVPTGGNGGHLVTATELDRVEISLGATGYDAWMLVGGRAGALPAGSRFDARTGVFVWQPAVGFTGRYDFLFTRDGEDSVPVTVLFQPKHASVNDVAFTIDTPVSGMTTDRWLTIAGWAFDRGARRGTGIDAVHVWAHPADGTAPIDLGVATYGGLRPDVAAALGTRWLASGFGLTTARLPPGTYDLAVFPHSSVSGTFAPAKVVRVTIR